MITQLIVQELLHSTRTIAGLTHTMARTQVSALYSSGTLHAQSLTYAFYTQDVDTEDVDHIALVSYKNVIIDAPKEVLARLTEQWHLPQAAINELLCTYDAQGLYTAANDRFRTMWYYIPTSAFGEAGQIVIGKGGIHVLHVSNTTSSRVCVLVVRTSFLRARILSSLEFFMRMLGSDQVHTEWSDLHRILLRAALKTWQRTIPIVRESAKVVVSTAPKTAW